MVRPTKADQARSQSQPSPEGHRRIDPARRPDEQLQDPLKRGSQGKKKQNEATQNQKTPGSHDPERKGRTDPGRRKSIGREKEDASR